MKSKITLFFHNSHLFPSPVYSDACNLHRIYHAESDPCPVYFHGTDARQEKWNVDRLFLWISG